MSAKRDRDKTIYAVEMDSFVDIVMDVMGTLFFVLIYVVLAVSGFRGRITTPIVTPGPTTPAYFELRNNMVYNLDWGQLLELTRSRKEECDRAGANQKACMQSLQTVGGQNDFYTVKAFLDKCSAQGPEFLRRKVEPRPNVRGESVFEFTRPQSAFSQALNRLDKKEKHVFFVVREDSFELFHEIRDFVTQRGFLAGWIPAEAATALQTGCPELGNLNSDAPQT